MLYHVRPPCFVPASLSSAFSSSFSMLPDLTVTMGSGATHLSGFPKFLGHVINLVLGA